MAGKLSLGAIKPLDIKRLNVRNNHHTMESNKVIGEMRKVSNSLLHAYDKDIEDMREKYGRLQTVRTPEPKPDRIPAPKAKTVKSPEPKGKAVQVTRNPARASSLKVAASKPQSKSVSDLSQPATKNGVSTTKNFKSSSVKVKKTTPKAPVTHSTPAATKPGQSFPRGKASTGSTKKKPGSIKKKSAEPEPTGPSSKSRISHNYCETIVYNSDTEEASNKIIPTARRGRSVSMFETDKDFVPPAILLQEEREMSKILEEREGSTVEGEEGMKGTRGADRRASMTLDEALSKMGENCPYKDLIN